MRKLVPLFAACTSAPAANPPPPPACPLPVGDLSQQVLASGDGVEDRYYWLHVPADYDCQTPLPLLIDFHGTASGNTPEEAYQTTALSQFADDEHIIVARPRSRSASFGGGELYQWDINPGDLPRNITFGDNLVTALEATYAIDPQRVYASGFSSGANMVVQFLGDSQSPFHGLAPIAGGDWSHVHLPSLAGGPRIYMATGYRDYLWPYARAQLAAMTTAGLPADRVEVRHTGGGHDLYPWHFYELWEFLDGGVAHGGGTAGAPWTASTLPSPADVNALADHGGTLVAAGAHGRTWTRGAQGWTLELDRDDADYTALCFGLLGASFVGGQDVATTGTSSGWGNPGTLPDYGNQLGIGWANSAACRDNGSIVVVGYWSAAQSADTGATWSQFDASTQYPGVQAQMAGIATSRGGATIATGYYDYVGRASGGATQPVAHAPTAEWWNAIAAQPGGLFWTVGDGGKILASADDGKTWVAQASGTSENLYAVHFADAMRGAAVGRKGAVVVTADGGATWTPRPLGADLYLGAVFVDATTVTVAGENGFIATSAL